MESIISSALEEICLQGQTGVSLRDLWPKLKPYISDANLDLSPGVKQTLWNGLLSVPTLQFQANTVCYSSSDPSIQSYHDAENLNLKFVAEERLRDNFLGLYNVQSANASISLLQRRTLQRLAAVRHDGLTQSDLSKEFGIEGRNFHYVLKTLECQGTIVRQSAVLKKKEACDEGESRYNPIVTTNLVCLSRYAKHLGSQQKFEIVKEEESVESIANVNSSNANKDGFGDKRVKEDVVVKDFLPAIKAVCDKLEKANDKVLVVSDIKKELGYSQRVGHREWRKISSRLKDAKLVQEFDAVVNEKVEHCFRLLKKFSPKSFESKTVGCVDNDCGEELVQYKNNHQNTNQLVELPIELQIYDVVDAAGSRGITWKEVCDMLGIDNKKNHKLFISLVSRFGMELQAEHQNKCKVYRVWASGKRNPESVNVISHSSIIVENNINSDVWLGNLDAVDTSGYIFPESGPSNLKSGVQTSQKDESRDNDMNHSNGFRNDSESNLLLCPVNSHESLSRDFSSEHRLTLHSTVMDIDVTPVTPADALNPLSSGSCPRYPCLSSTVDSSRREKRILERLEIEKFILRAELHKWLASVEKEKCSTTDRKTIDRTLNKLQKLDLCRCIQINVPVITNCGRSRIIQVVLHPSIQSLSPELVSEIHDRLRSFEIQSRGNCSYRLKNDGTLPILEGVDRTQNHAVSNAHSLKSEAMRANGFILAKMVRAKLLHIFLWDYMHISKSPDAASPSENCSPELRNPHSSSKLFSLEAAIKAIPVELFLQVVGSTQSFDDMIEKCKRRLCLSDLSAQEYKSLMDTHATGRLSLIIDILRRLKLIRMVSQQCSKDGMQIGDTTFTHAMELKPYIEEPMSKDAISWGSGSLDLRPRFRHDFTLSSREAVNEYWQTLEYCYAATNPRVALHAFPGSAVHEVFLFRSWASARVMTADQRAELLRRIMKENLTGKPSYRECRKIASDLNLTLEQVLRVYYDKRQRFNRLLHEKDDFEPSNTKQSLSSQRRKRSLEARPERMKTVDEQSERLNDQSLSALPCTGGQCMEEQNIIVTSGKDYTHLQELSEDDHLQTEEEPASKEDDGGYYSIFTKSAFSKMKPTRQRRFSWTEKADRQLLMQYARYRAALGAKYNRTDWASLPDLPASPSHCRKRMASLKSNLKFRKSLMRLCNILSERYAKFLERMQGQSLDKADCRLKDSRKPGLIRNVFNGNEHFQETCLQEEAWDDFENISVKLSFDEVLHCKKQAKFDSSERVRFTSEGWSDLNMDGEECEAQEPEANEVSPCEGLQNHSVKRQRSSARKLECQRLHKKFSKLLNAVNVNGQVHQSLAVSNAIELFKLIFLSTSTEPEVSNLLAEILRRYSEHDLFAAFNYLREKRIMVGDGASQPFSLSQQFLHSISKSPFPTDSGKRAAKFAQWLHENERDLLDAGINLPGELHCGDIFHLLALVSSGQLSVSPCLPNEGVGEAEDMRGLKRKIDNNECSDGYKTKKLKSLVPAEGEGISRREKGFPGLVVSIHRAAFPTANAIELFGVENTCTSRESVDGKDQSQAISGQTNTFPSDHKKEILGSSTSISITEHSNDSPWKSMAEYAELLLPAFSDQQKSSTIGPEVFQALYTAIQKAGDQGLSMVEVSHFIDEPGENMADLIVSVLQTFGRALKVNAYNTVNVVDALYHSKYFMTSVGITSQDLTSPSQKMPINGGSHLVSELENHDPGNAHTQGEINMTVDDLHRVTILNCPKDLAEPFNENQTNNTHGGCSQGEVITSVQDKEDKSYKISFGGSCVPILPWINGDGTTNKIIYKGLRRRVLGIVMQNPGILEDEIIWQMDALSPQSCRKLLELMILDKHLLVKKMLQTTSNGSPSILGIFFRSSLSKQKLICREHFFANPLSTSLL